METREYYIDYIYRNPITDGGCYHQLVRRADEAILYANADLNQVFLHCWMVGISREQVVVL